MVHRFITGVSAALIALSFTAGAAAQSAPSELKTNVVITQTSSPQPNIVVSVYNNGSAEASKGKKHPPPPKPDPDEFLTIILTSVLP